MTEPDPNSPRTLYCRLTVEEVAALANGDTVTGSIGATGDVPAIKLHMSMIPPSKPAAAAPMAFTPVTEG